MIMLSGNMLAKLNEQIGVEFESANLYLQMSSWCASQGLNGCASFLRDHSQEEMGHMTRLFDYVIETGGQALLPALPKPQHEFESVKELFMQTYEHEQFVTGKINELVDTAFGEKDYSTFTFLQWYVGEQHEEEALFKGILDQIEIVGVDGRGLFMLDREIGAMKGGGGPPEAE
jgi:ferritin